MISRLCLHYEQFVRLKTYPVSDPPVIANESMPTNFFALIPNAITAVRLVLAFLFPFLPESWHLGVIAIALLSEFLDGFVARLLNAESYLGQVFDPIADKVFFFSVALTWTLMEKLSLTQWALLGARDIGVILVALGIAVTGHAGSVKSIKAQFLSKLATTLQYLVMGCILFDVLKPVSILITLTAITGCIAVAQYIYLLRKSARHPGA